LYRLTGEEEELALQDALQIRLGQPVPTLPPTDELGARQKRNLRTLALAVKLVDKGSLQEAIDALDSLSGRCKSCAESWTQLARKSLLSQQASNALLARTLCLNASVSK